MTPRVVTFITAKRNVPLAGRSYGHWWVEVGEDESYGWWPSRLPLHFRDAVRGVPGVLNGVGVTHEGSPTRDPNHGLPADYEFHPVLLVTKTDDELREDIRAFAQEFARRMAVVDAPDHELQALPARPLRSSRAGGRHRQLLHAGHWVPGSGTRAPLREACHGHTALASKPAKSACDSGHRPTAYAA